MSTQNESTKLPGFFFYPANPEGLEELTMDQRMQIKENQGNYMMPLNKPSNEMQRVDMICNLDNARIPTHRVPGTVIPPFGYIPFDLRELVQA